MELQGLAGLAQSRMNFQLMGDASIDPEGIHMIVETKLLNGSPTIVYHRVSGSLSEADAAEAAQKAMSMIGNIANEESRFDLIMDMRGYIFDDLNAHRIWSINFKEQKMLKDHVGRLAIIGDDSPRLSAEKEMMESDVLRFFTDLGVAEEWLKTLTSP